LTSTITRRAELASEELGGNDRLFLIDADPLELEYGDALLSDSRSCDQDNESNNRE
jgi:hypothetical protein